MISIITHELLFDLLCTAGHYVNWNTAQPEPVHVNVVCYVCLQ